MRRAILFVCVALLGVLPVSAVSERTFDYMEEFSEGLAVVRQNGQWGYVDVWGNVVVPLEYDGAEAFQEGTGRVRKGPFYGFVNALGEEVIEPKYTVASPFSDGLSAVMFDGKMGAIDVEGNVKIAFEYDYLSGFREGFAVFGNHGYYGFLDTSGKKVFGDRAFRYAEPFHSGLALVQDLADTFYFIDPKGRVQIIGYDSVEPFIEGFAIASRGGNKLILDRTGRNVTGATYDIAEDLENGYIAFHTGVYAGVFEKKTGKVWFQHRFSMLQPPSEGILLAVEDGRYVFLKEDWTRAIRISFSYAESFHDGRALVAQNERYGFIDTTGNVVIPAVYEEARSFEDGLAVVRIGKYFGAIDKTGNMIIPMEYGYIGRFENGIAVAKRDGRYQILYNPLMIGMGVSAVSSRDELRVNGNSVMAKAYKIGGYNYFKLRDIAAALGATNKAFSVEYSPETKRISIKTGDSYVGDGTELRGSRDEVVTKTVRYAPVVLFCNDKPVRVDAYNIDGFNYVKLRDLAEIVRFGLVYDGVNRLIDVFTK